MTSKRDRKKYLKLFSKEQDYKDRLLQLQSLKLIEDKKGAEEIKELQELLADNQKKIDKLSVNNKNLTDSGALLQELSLQVNDMHKQLHAHKRKLFAYREAAKKFKNDLDQAEKLKKEFLEEVGLYDEYTSIQSAVKLTKINKASENVTSDLIQLSDSQKIKQRLHDEESHSLLVPEISETIEPDTITVFSELDDYDDLSQIKGIGPKFEILLNNEGIHTFEQIAGWSDAEVQKRDKRLVFRGRISREDWVSQAKQLIEGRS